MLGKISRLRAITALVAVSAAAASGYFMQDDTAPVLQSAALAPISAPTVEALPGPTTPALPSIGEVARAASPPILALTSAAPILPEAPESEVIMLASTGAEMTAPGIVSEDIFAQSPMCEAGFTAMAAPGAMVDLTLEAPCHAGQKVDIFHAGMRFTEVLDQAGLMQITLPAMEEDALFNAQFSDGQIKSAEILMLTANDYQRTALFWKGATGFALYALEGGALYGESGHVSAETPYTPVRGTSAEGGFLTKFGQDKSGYHAWIYSYPTMLTDSGPAPEISIEAKVLPGTCGSEITATILRNLDAGGVKAMPLIMAVPGCDAVGEYLVLKNLPQNLRLATK